MSVQHLGLVSIGDDIAELARRAPGWCDTGSQHQRATERRRELLAHRQIVRVEQPAQHLRAFDWLAVEGHARGDRRLVHNQPGLAWPQDVQVLLVSRQVVYYVLARRRRDLAGQHPELA